MLATFKLLSELAGVVAEEENWVLLICRCTGAILPSMEEELQPPTTLWQVNF